MAQEFRFYAIKLTVLIVGIFILQVLFADFTEMFLLDARAFGEYWRFLTAVLLHGGVAHLLYNGFALALFGSILERLIGGRKFLYVFFVSGIIANIVSVNFYDSSLGASGAIFGIIGALIVIRPLMMVWAFGLPMPMILAGVLWAVGDVIGIFIPDNIGNIAHLSGLFLGLLLGAIFRSGAMSENREHRIVLNEREMRNWENQYMR